jgi:hypothetical protein
MARPTSALAAVPHASKSFLRLNPQLAATKAPAVDMSHDPHDVRPAKKSLRQKSGPKLNKTEAAFLQYISQFYPAERIGIQDVTLHLANGCRYTPDFRVGWHSFYEVKGHMRDDAAVKIKVAAARFTDLQLFLVFRDKNQPSGWRIEEVLQ